VGSLQAVGQSIELSGSEETGVPQIVLSSKCQGEEGKEKYVVLPTKKTEGEVRNRRTGKAISQEESPIRENRESSEDWEGGRDIRLLKKRKRRQVSRSQTVTNRCSSEKKNYSFIKRPEPKTRNHPFKSVPGLQETDGLATRRGEKDSLRSNELIGKTN